MAINILVTHSGGFHADELLSSVVLTRLFPEASLMRSRDELCITCLLYTSPSPRDGLLSRMPSSA